MKYLQILIFSWLSSNAIANNCHQDFSEKEIIGSVKSGHSILYPFQFTSLINGKDEPEIQRETIGIESKERIVKLASHLYQEANRRGAVRKTNKTSEAEREIIYRDPNSGFYVSMYFRQVKGCWFMAGLANEST